ncbi:MAG: hypothetical protein E6G21_05215 [Actinobacteria bacterium]|nr:MAG: hypothetical protein E6G21_05215 [Actinomycetota bacterium]
MTAGIRKTIVVWYDWLRGVRTTKSCAIAAAVPRIANVNQPFVPTRRWVSKGTETTAVTPPMTKK